MLHRLTTAVSQLAVGVSLLLFCVAASAVPELEIDLGDAGGEVLAGESTRISFHFIDDVSGYPLGGLHPGAWIRVARPGRSDCRSAIANYLAVGANNSLDIDLNAYSFLSLHADNSIGVIDPRLNLASSNLLWLQQLPETPVSWRLDHAAARVFVTLPEAGEVRAYDLLNGNLLWRQADLSAPAESVFTALRDALWVADREAGEVVALSPASGEVTQRVATGGKVDALVSDARGIYLYALDTGPAWVAQIDTGSASVLRRWKLPAGAASLQYSPLAESLYVGHPGSPKLLGIPVFERTALVDIELEQAADLLMSDQQGRYVFALNRENGLLQVVDTARQRVRHLLVFHGLPDQLAVSDDYLYLREREEPRVSLVHIGSLDVEATPGVLDVVLGSRKPPAKEIPLAAIAPLPEGGGAMIAGEADKSLYLYRETGMQAPNNAFRLWSAAPVAVAIHDRSLQEQRPGEYSAIVRFPAPGEYEVLTQLAQPPLTDCRTVTVGGEGEAIEQAVAFPKVSVDAEVRERSVSLVFDVRDRGSQAPVDAVVDLQVMAMQPGSGWHTRGLASREAAGRYRYEFKVPQAGSYRVFFASVEHNLPYDANPAITVEVPQ